MMLFADHQLEMRNFSWQYRIKYMMKNKEIEAWFEGVIIGPGMTQFVNEARADDATRPAVADMGFKDGVAPWRGPLHV